MEINQTKLFSSYANTIFGSDRAPMSSDWLEATLRYIAVKHNGGDISDTKPIKVYEGDYKSGNPGIDYANAYCDREQTVFIFKSSTYNPLTVDGDGWEPIGADDCPTTRILSQAAPTTIYYNEDRERAVVFVKAPTAVWIRRFISLLPRILKWIFKDGGQICDEEQKLIRAVDSADTEAFIGIINNLCESVDFRSWKIKKELFGWNNAYRTARIKSLRSLIDSAYYEIQQYEEKLAAQHAIADARKTDIDALINAAPEDNAELCDFFNSHKQLEIERVTKNPDIGNTLTYTVVETIDYYDRDEFISYYENPRSYFYGDSISDETRRVFYGIFARNKGKFRAESRFELKNQVSLRALSGRSGVYSDIAIPHPHIANHSCLGGNAQYVKKYMESGDWDMAIEQTIAATKNIYFGDSIVVSGAMYKFTNYSMDVRCIIADNGIEMTPREFLSYINEENTNG